LKKVFSALLMLTACFLFVVTVSAATGNGTITYGGTPFELIEDTGTDVYATVRASSLPNGSVNVNAIMQKKFLLWWTNQANAIVPVQTTNVTYYAQFAANAPGQVRALFDNLSSGRSLTGRFQLY